MSQAATITSTITGDLGRIAGENVGTYAYSIGSLAVSTPTNYTTNLTAGTFAITPATLTINPTASQSVIYGASDPAGGFTFSSTGLVTGVTPAIGTAVVSMSLPRPLIIPSPAILAVQLVKMWEPTLIASVVLLLVHQLTTPPI